jgi:hypothetical protein
MRKMLRTAILGQCAETEIVRYLCAVVDVSIDKSDCVPSSYDLLVNTEL